MQTERVVRGALMVLGGTAVCTGSLVALRGAASIPGGAAMQPSNESVLRFYSVWWAGQGVAAWRLAHDPRLPEREVRVLLATTFVGGLARLLAMRDTGRPHPLFVALAALELAAPPLLVLASRTSRRR